MDATEIRKQIADYAENGGYKITTVCQRAFGDAHRYERLGSQIEKNRTVLRKFKAYVAANPLRPPAAATDQAHSEHCATDKRLPAPNPDRENAA